MTGQIFFGIGTTENTEYIFFKSTSSSQPQPNRFTTHCRRKLQKPEPSDKLEDTMPATDKRPEDKRDTVAYLCHRCVGSDRANAIFMRNREFQAGFGGAYPAILKIVYKLT